MVDFDERCKFVLNHSFREYWLSIFIKTMECDIPLIATFWMKYVLLF